MFRQKKLSGGARFGLAVASFFLGLLLFVTAITTALVADVRIVTSDNGINGLVRELLFSPAQARPKAPVSVHEGGLAAAPQLRTYQMPRREEPEGVASSLTDKLIEMFYEEMKDMFGEEMTFSQEEFTQMINDSTVKDYIADKTAGLITDFWNDEVTTTFEAEEVIALINENEALIESIIGQPLPEDIAQQVAKVFDENEIVTILEKEGLAGFMRLAESSKPGDEGIMDAESAGGVFPFDLREVINTVQQYTSTGILIACIAVCLVLIAAILLINCHQLGKGLRRAGYPLMLAGFMVILNILAQYAPQMWVITSGDAEMVQTANLALKLVRHILLQTAGVNIAIFCTGLALCIGGIVLPIVLRAKNTDIVTVPTTPETDELVDAIAEETSVETLPEAEETTEEDPAPVAE